MDAPQLMRFLGPLFSENNLVLHLGLVHQIAVWSQRCDLKRRCCVDELRSLRNDVEQAQEIPVFLQRDGHVRLAFSMNNHQICLAIMLSASQHRFFFLSMFRQGFLASSMGSLPICKILDVPGSPPNDSCVTSAFRLGPSCRSIGPEAAAFF